MISITVLANASERESDTNWIKITRKKGGEEGEERESEGREGGREGGRERCISKREHKYEWFCKIVWTSSSMCGPCLSVNFIHNSDLVITADIGWPLAIGLPNTSISGIAPVKRE